MPYDIPVWSTPKVGRDQLALVAKALLMALVLSGISTRKMPPKNCQAASQASIARAVVSSKVGYTNR
jgi:hypothetical protein